MTLGCECLAPLDFSGAPATVLLLQNRRARKQQVAEGYSLAQAFQDPWLTPQAQELGFGHAALLEGSILARERPFSFHALLA